MASLESNNFEGSKLARINIEESFWRNHTKLAIRVGCQHLATGYAVNFFRLAQARFKDGRVITEQEFEIEGFPEALIGIFAERVDGGIMAIGAENNFGWLRDRVEAARKGGKSRSAAKLKYLNRGGENPGDNPEANPKQTKANESKPEASYSYSSSSSGIQEEREPEKKHESKILKLSETVCSDAKMENESVALTTRVMPDQPNPVSNFEARFKNHEDPRRLEFMQAIALIVKHIPRMGSVLNRARHVDEAMQAFKTVDAFDEFADSLIQSVRLNKPKDPRSYVLSIWRDQVTRNQNSPEIELPDVESFGGV